MSGLSPTNASVDIVVRLRRPFQQIAKLRSKISTIPEQLCFCATATVSTTGFSSSSQVIRNFNSPSRSSGAEVRDVFQPSPSVACISHFHQTVDSVCTVLVRSDICNLPSAELTPSVIIYFSVAGSPRRCRGGSFSVRVEFGGG